MIWGIPETRFLPKVEGASKLDEYYGSYFDLVVVVVIVIIGLGSSFQ